jgi:hypothetical protein
VFPHYRRSFVLPSINKCPNLTLFFFNNPHSFTVQINNPLATMKFAVASVLALVLGTQATIVARDLTQLTNIINDIDAATKALGTAASGYTTDFVTLQSAASKLQGLINSGVAAFNANAALNIAEAAQLAGTVADLVKDVTTTIDGIVAKKSVFESTQKTAEVLKTLQEQKAASQSLADAITAKVPADLKEAAVILSAQISDALVKGITAFTGSSPPPASSSSSSIITVSSSVEWTSSSVASTAPVSSTSIASSASSSSSYSHGGHSTPISSSTWASATSDSATAPASSTWVSKSHSGHGSKTSAATGGASSPAESSTYVWSKPALSSPASPTSATPSTPAVATANAAAAYGFNGVLAVAAAAVLAF